MVHTIKINGLYYVIYTRERARKNIAAKVSYFFETKKIPSKNAFRRNWLATKNSLCSLRLPPFLLSPQIKKFAGAP
jgi:hypothetical protein